MAGFARSFRELEVYQTALEFMTKEAYKELDKRYEHLLSQIVIMINNADKWCTL